MNSRGLYEAIMRHVAVKVKKAINEGMNNNTKYIADKTGYTIEQVNDLMELLPYYFKYDANDNGELLVIPGDLDMGCLKENDEYYVLNTDLDINRCIFHYDPHYDYEDRHIDNRWKRIPIRFDRIDTIDKQIAEFSKYILLKYNNTTDKHFSNKKVVELIKRLLEIDNDIYEDLCNCIYYKKYDNFIKSAKKTKVFDRGEIEYLYNHWNECIDFMPNVIHFPNNNYE